MFVWLISSRDASSSDLPASFADGDTIIFMGEAIYLASQFQFNVAVTVGVIEADCRIRGVEINDEQLVTYEQLLLLIAKADKVIQF